MDVYEKIKKQMDFINAEGKSYIERRSEVLFSALNEKQGLKFVDQKLQEKYCHGLYVRNPIEFILKVCFRRNEIVPDDGKYGMAEFEKMLKIYNENLRQIEPIPFEVDKNTTLKDLWEFVAQNSDQYDEENTSFKTKIVTKIFEDKINSLDFSSENLETDVIEVMKQQANNYSLAVKSMQFYLCKYLMYMIIAQCYELKTTLLEMSQTTPVRIYNDIIKNYYEQEEKYTPVSLMYDLQYFDGKYGGRDQEGNIIWEPGFQASKEFLNSITTNFALFGTNEDTQNPILKGGISGIRNKAIFLTDKKLSENRDRKHEKIVEDIKQIALSDFMGFKIDFDKVYNLLFEKLVLNRNEVKGKTKEKRDFIKSIISGEHDLSRLAFMMFITSVGVIANENIEKLRESKDKLFTVPEDAFVDRLKVAHILERTGHELFGACEYDEEYAKVLDNPAMDEITDIDGMFDNDILLPFEIINISCQDRYNAVVEKYAKEKQGE